MKVHDDHLHHSYVDIHAADQSHHQFQNNHHQLPEVHLETEHKVEYHPTADHHFVDHSAHDHHLPVPDPHDNHKHIAAILEKLRADSTSHHNDQSRNLLWHRRISKRSLFGFWTTTTTTTTPAPERNEYHPTLISHEDRWLAGCLMQCIFRKNDAVDKHGYPTLDGLVNLYTVGTTEQKFFVHVLRSVDKCLKGTSVKHHIFRGKVPLKGETCDIAFDVFDCVSDSITQYCSSHY